MLERFTKPCWPSLYAGNVMPCWRWWRAPVWLSGWIRNQFLRKRCYFLFQLLNPLFVFRSLHLHPFVLMLETISAALSTFDISKTLLFESVCGVRRAFRWVLAVLFRFRGGGAAGTSHLVVCLEWKTETDRGIYFCKVFSKDASRVNKLERMIEVWRKNYSMSKKGIVRRCDI